MQRVGFLVKLVTTGRQLTECIEPLHIDEVVRLLRLLQWIFATIAPAVRLRTKVADLIHRVTQKQRHRFGDVARCRAVDDDMAIISPRVEKLRCDTDDRHDCEETNCSLIHARKLTRQPKGTNWAFSRVWLR